MFTVITAVNNYGYIGKDNQIPWHDEQDLKEFWEAIDGKEVIVGYNTFNSMPQAKLMAHASNIVLWDGKKSMLQLAEEHPDAWVIGGRETYKQALESGNVRKIIMTLIDDETIGDVKFPFESICHG